MDKNIIEKDLRDTKKLLHFVDGLHQSNSLDFMSGNIKESDFIIINKFLNKVMKNTKEYYDELQEELKQHE
jgi:hypothetical protein